MCLCILVPSVKYLVRCEGRYVFSCINHSLRTDEEYVRCVDEDHHKEGKSPLSMLPMGIVSQTPFEYMHLICLGVMKKFCLHGYMENTHVCQNYQKDPFLSCAQD
jgi:hypothetical protein